MCATHPSSVTTYSKSCTSDSSATAQRITLLLLSVDVRHSGRDRATNTERMNDLLSPSRFVLVDVLVSESFQTRRTVIMTSAAVFVDVSTKRSCLAGWQFPRRVNASVRRIEFGPQKPFELVQ